MMPEHADTEDSALDAQKPISAGESHTISVRERWLAAICYAGPLWCIPAIRHEKGHFVGWHMRQGFALFFAEIVVFTLLWIIDNTLARIPVLGWLFFIVSILLQLAAFVAALILSVLGFVKSLAAEPFHIPVLEDYAQKVPLGD